MKKTFTEVVEDIRKNEIWENEKIKIYIDDNNKLCIISKNVIKDDCAGIIIDLDDMFTLQRKEYDFSEAYKSYKEGKEIESLESGYSRMKLINGTNMFYSKISNKWVDETVMTFEQIDGKWYIYD